MRMTPKNSSAISLPYYKSKTSLAYHLKTVSVSLSVIKPNVIAWVFIFIYLCFLLLLVEILLQHTPYILINLISMCVLNLVESRDMGHADFCLCFSFLFFQNYEIFKTYFFKVSKAVSLVCIKLCT